MRLPSDSGISSVTGHSRRLFESVSMTSKKSMSVRQNGEWIISRIVGSRLLPDASTFTFTFFTATSWPVGPNDL
jgi:hypothetical protein